MGDVIQWPGDPEWRQSWDGNVHGFHQRGELTSTALCGHVARNTSLKQPPDDARMEPACREIYERRLVAGYIKDHGEDWRRPMSQQQETPGQTWVGDVAEAARAEELPVEQDDDTEED